MKRPQWTVEPGDALETIAYRCGVSPSQLWNDERNAELRRLRKNPENLQPGDVLNAPAIREDQHPLEPGKIARFRRKHAPAWLHLTVSVDNEPRVRAIMVCIIDGRRYRLLTGEEGKVQCPFPMTAEKAQLMPLYGDRTPDIELNLKVRRTEIELEVEEKVLKIVAEVVYRQPPRRG